MNIFVYVVVMFLMDFLFYVKFCEDIVDGDFDFEFWDEVFVFYGLLVSGDVRGNFVYVGYGCKKDFDFFK